MISRRLVRVKAMQTYYSFIQNNEDINLEKVWNNLEQSLNKSYELYISLHCLLLQISNYANNKIDIKKNKFLPTAEELNPNFKFVNNKVFASFRANSLISKYMSNISYNWKKETEIVKSIYNTIEKSNFYKQYMSSKDCSLENDITVIRGIIFNSIANNKDLDDCLEEKSIYWNDEIELLLSNIITNTSKIKEETGFVYILSPMYKNSDDEEFAKNIITKCLKNRKQYDELLSNTLKEWELERIALMDRIILHFILCEIIDMPDMPISIILDEWLEISKYYSTNKSSKFINGVVDKIYTQLKNERKIFK